MSVASETDSISASVGDGEGRGAAARRRPAILALIGAALGGAIHAAMLRAETARLEPELAAALGFVCVGGLALMLLMREGFALKKLAAAAGWGLLWAIPYAWAFHRGMQFDFAGRDGTLAASSVAAVFLAAPFLAGEFSYRKLFARMCDNILAAGAGVCIAAISSLLVHLGAELFAILGINFIKEWKDAPLFNWLFFPAIFGAGLSLPVWRFRRLALLTFRLPAAFAAVLALTFAAALGAAGPAPLWERDIAAPLLLAFTALLLLFAAAAFGDGVGAKDAEAEEAEEEKEGGSGKWTRGILAMSLLVLPVFSGLALWGLWLRVEQYGLTPLRIWGGYAGLFLLLSSLFYGACGLFSLIFMRGEAGRWLGGLRWANPILAWVAIGVLYFSHAVVLDPWRVSANSQTARAADGASDLRDVDLGVFYEYGGYGAAGLAELETLLRAAGGERGETLLAEMERLRLAAESGELERVLAARGWESAATYGEATATAAEIVRAMKLSRPYWKLTCAPPAECALLALDLTGDAEVEHCLIRSYPDYAWLDCFVRSGESFERLGDLVLRTRTRNWFSELQADLRAGEWESRPAAVRDVVIGGKVFFLSPDRENW